MIAIVIGGFIGLLALHGMLGAMMGGAVGWMIHSRLMRRRTLPMKEFISPLFVVLGALAKRDGRVSEAEIAAAEKLMNRLKLKAEQRREAIASFNRGKQPHSNLEPSFRRLRQWASGRKDHAVTILNMTIDVMLADGPTEDKFKLIQQLAAGMHIGRMELLALMAMKGSAWTPAGGGGGWHRQGQSWQHQNRRKATAPSNKVNPYTVLGVSPNADASTIKRAYRKLIAKHHPDRMGRLSAAKKRYAENRASEINAAYESLKAQHGFH